MIRKAALRSDLLRNILTLITGTTLAQFIPVLLQPILRRIYTPEEFGFFAVYLSISGILIVIAALRFDAAIVLPAKEEEAKNLLGLALIINFFYSLLVLLLILLLQPFLLQLLNIDPAFRLFLYLVPLSVFLFGMALSLNYWLIRLKAFKASSLNKITRRGSEAFTQLGMGVAAISPGLLIGDIVGKVFLNISSLLQISKKGLQLQKIFSGELRATAKKYSHFPKFYALPSLLDAASLLLPVLFINKFYDTTTTGYVDLCIQVLALPLALISAAISQVLYQRLAEKKNKGEKIGKLLLLISGSLAVMAAVGVIVIQLFGVELFSIVFGREWALSGAFAQILIFSFAVRFFIVPITVTLTALEKIKTIAVWQIIYFTGICMLIFFRHLPVERFLTIYVIIDIFAYLIYLTIISWYTTRWDKRVA